MLRDFDIENQTSAITAITRLISITRNKMRNEENVKIKEELHLKVDMLASELNKAQKGDKEVIKKALEYYWKEVKQHYDK